MAVAESDAQSDASKDAPSEAPLEASETARVVPVSTSEWRGEISAAYLPEDIDEALEQLDPGAAIETIHWGRNYLYRSRWPSAKGPVDVVVKQFRHGSWRARWSRRRKGSKAQRSYYNARTLSALGVGTAEPILYIESHDLHGPALFVSRHLENHLEARYLVRALESGSAERDFPGVDADRFFECLGRLVRRLHQADIWHRDLTSGNVLIDTRRLASDGPDALSLLDLNRARVGRRLGLGARMRELSRMPAPTPSVRRAFLDGYFGARSSPARRWQAAWYELARRTFLLRNSSKKKVRSWTRRLADVFLPRRTPHAHIPEAPKSSSTRDRSVWDRLSDQPHQHASKLQKLRIRVADAPEHAGATMRALRGLGRARSRYKQLRETLYEQPVDLPALSVSLKSSGRLESELELLDELGAGEAVLRVHPWSGSYDADLELARELSARGLELTLVVPQNRELVLDPERWRAQLEQIRELFAPLTSRFQIGQAPNRSKWGVWRHSEYRQLLQIADQVLRARDTSCELWGPSVIDFEYNATAAYLNDSGIELDGVASLLYCDRRGAPENPQLGFDLVGKVVLLKALAETGVSCPSGRSRVTEFNWPLWEGPHSPAGRDVAVSEDLQAAYLMRYWVAAMATGCVEQCSWWQLVAKGYGLIDPDGLRRRPSFEAFRLLQREIAGAVSHGPVGTASEVQRLYRFERRDGSEVVIGWALAPAGSRGQLHRPASTWRAIDGAGRCDGVSIELTAMPRLFELV